MLKILILICATGLSQADCSIDTATAVVQGPQAASLMECGLHGQAYLANTALAGYVADGHYLKIRCEPSVIARRPPSRPAGDLRTAGDPAIR
jgi:hypothetical protein